MVYIYDTTLIIKPLEDNDSSSSKIEFILHSDIKELQFQLPYIRFSFDRESIKLLSETDVIPVSETNKDTIKDSLNFWMILLTIFR